MENALPYFLGLLIWGLSVLMLLFRRTQWLLVFSIILSVFQASSVLNFYLAGRGHGVEPVLISLLCFMIAVFMERDRGSYLQVIKFFWPFYLFLLWAVILNFLGPVLFKGLPVANPWFGVGDSFEPLHWSLTNLNYSIYLIFYFAVFTSLIVYLNLICSDSKKIKEIFLSIFISFLIVFVLSCLQIIFYLFDFSWPVFILNNRLGAAQLYTENVAGMVRTSAGFIEPSQLALYLSGIFSGIFFLLMKVKINKKNHFFLLLLIALVSINLFLTASTEGYLVILIVMVIAGFSIVLSGQLKNSLKYFSVCLLVVCIFILQSFVVHEALHSTIVNHNQSIVSSSDAVFQSIQEQVIHKQKTDSFHQRSGTDLQALETFYQSWFIGIGGGSYRSSSFIISFLVGNGIIGLILVVGFLIKLYQLNEKSEDCSMFLKIVRGFFGASFGGNLLAASLAVSDINIAIFWINLSLWVGLIFLKKKSV